MTILEQLISSPSAALLNLLDEDLAGEAEAMTDPSWGDFSNAPPPPAWNNWNDWTNWGNWTN
ncbi:hypothetical protein ABT369_04830 [Dactylosporangium sp. NPDC000244]|uniref:hypothetical protein n=1 Tax=Dactylosporangium sp. NPDC000244 TaxID=3154365 RepID=UPI003326086D